MDHASHSLAKEQCTMADETPPPSVTAAQAQARLQELAQILREGRPVDPDTRQRLAGLVTQLGQDLERPDLPPTEAAHVAEAIGLVTQSLQRPEKWRPGRAAGEGLRGLVARAEAEAPIATRFAEQLIDILANLGI
jgi:hypothetical protein